MIDEVLEQDVGRALSALTQRSVGHLLLLGAAAMVAFAWTDQFLVPEGSRIHWLVARLLTATILSAMFFANKSPSGGRYSQVYAYVGALLCTGVILAMNIRLGEFPSSHYAAIIVIVAGLCLVTWDARNTLIVGATSVSAWLIVNFAWRAPFDAEAFGFHAGYLGTGLLISTVVSHGRQRLTIQMLEPVSVKVVVA